MRRAPVFAPPCLFCIGEQSEMRSWIAGVNRIANLSKLLPEFGRL